MGQFDFNTGQTASGVVDSSLFDAHTILYATTDNTPVALTLTEQTLAGRLTGGNISAVALGISDNNIAQIDGTSNAPANLDYAKFTTSGLEGKSYQELVNDISGVIKATDVEVSELSTATYDDAQDYINFFGDRTLLSGGGISARADALTGVNTGGAGSASFEISGDLTATYKEDDIITVNGSTANDGNYTLKADSTHAGGTTTITVDEAVSDSTVDGSIYGAANVASGTAWAKATDSDTAVGKFFNFSADNTVTLTNLVTNYIYLDYNADTPQMAVSTSIVTLGFKQDHIHIATIFRNGNTLHYHEEDALGIGRINIADMRLLEMHDADRASGLITTDAASLALNVSAGVIYEGLNRHTIDAQIPASWSTWYTSDSGSTWTEVTGQSTIDNAQYNDVTSGLEDLTSNRYAVHWLYVDIDGANLFIIYGQDNYTINGAEEAGVPAYLPDIAVHYGVLIAKIIVQQNQTPLEILYPWTTTFHSSKATDHGNLAGLGGDDHVHYLLADGTRALAGAWDMGSQNLTNVNIDGGTISGATLDGSLTGGAQTITGLGNVQINDGSNNGILFIGDGNTTADATAWGNLVRGIQIDQGGEDGPLISLKSSDVSHGMTTLAQVDTYGSVRKASATGGGLLLHGLTDTDVGGGQAIVLMGSLGEEPDATKTTAARGVVEIHTFKKSGTSHAVTAGTDNILTICAGSTAQFVFGANGNFNLTGGFQCSSTSAMSAPLNSTSYVRFAEMTAPGALGANTAGIYAVVGGDTLTDLSAVFQDGSIDNFATETTPDNSPLFVTPSKTQLGIELRKDHPGLIRIVAIFPDGREFDLKHHEFHDADKIAANKGCDSPLPDGWEVTTLQERVDKNVAELDEMMAETTDLEELAKLEEKKQLELERVKINEHEGLQ